MHYYQFNIADYRKDTTHLTPMEHYIYRTLIDWCYLEEGEIPKETQSVLRRLRLDSESAILLQNVLDDFFVATESGWVHKRIAIDIENYHAMQERNKANGSRGGRPKKQQLSNENKPKKTQSVSVGLRNETICKGNQEPITNNQEPIKKANAQNAVAFDAFWTAYPKKKDRKKSEQAWLKLKLTDEQVGEILKKLAQQVMQPSWLKDDGQYIPYPTTYLNGRRWEDDLEPVAQTASAKNQFAPKVVPMSKADREAYDLMQKLTGGGHV